MASKWEHKEFDSLPNEIYCEIFQLLHPAEQLRLRQVNSRWNSQLEQICPSSGGKLLLALLKNGSPREILQRVKLTSRLYHIFKKVVKDGDNELLSQIAGLLIERSDSQAIIIHAINYIAKLGLEEKHMNLIIEFDQVFRETKNP
jgi:F-box-like